MTVPILIDRDRNIITCSVILVVALKEKNQKINVLVSNTYIKNDDCLLLKIIIL